MAFAFLATERSSRVIDPVYPVTSKSGHLRLLMRRTSEVLRTGIQRVLTRGATRAILPPPMRSLAAASALALALGLAGCGKSACQELGEKICACQPGLGSDACKTQVEEQLRSNDPGDAFCEQRLAACNPPAGNLCEWLLTSDGKKACGLAPP